MVNNINQVYKDVSKRVLIIPQLLLKWINLWPEKQSPMTVSVFGVMLMLMVVLELGQVIYFALNIKDVATVASIMSTISTTLQAICKASAIYFHRNRLRNIIKAIEGHFWPSNFLGPETQQTLSFQGNVAIYNMITILVCAIVFAAGLLSAPLRDGTKNLPFLSWYPFDFSVSPQYEIIYVLQCLINECYIVTSICAHDFLFFAVCTNCIAQFKMLKQAMAKIGTEEGAKLNLNLEKLTGARTFKYQDDTGFGETELLVRCVQHHSKLLRISNDIEIVFSATNFVQLLCSVVAICVSSFLIVMTDNAQIVHLSFYCAGHVLQLFMFCAPANELAYQSQSLTTHAFGSSWDDKSLSFKRNLLLVLLLSQKTKKISALGIVDLNYPTFISVLRLSFSFYTLLSRMVEK